MEALPAPSPLGPTVSGVVRAAGGVVVRDGATPAVLVVHRPSYDDWSFPKGKAEPGERDEDCAIREVAEETGLVCALSQELPSTSYRDSRGRAKHVRYWRMEPVGGELTFEHEVDDARWVTTPEARELLTYRRDVDVLRALEELLEDASRLT